MATTELDDGAILLAEFKGLAAAQIDLAERISAHARQAFTYVTASTSLRRLGRSQASELFRATIERR